MGWQPSLVRIASPLGDDGDVNVDVRSRHTLPLDLNFLEKIGDTTLASSASVGDTTLDLVNATGFVDGNKIEVEGLTSTFFAQQIGAPSGNIITVDTPMDAIKITGRPVDRFNNNMNVLGTLTTPRIFQIGAAGSIINNDITRVMGYIQSGSAMDDSKFGSLTALTNGIVLRRVNADIENYWNIKTNGELALITCGDFDYTIKAPAGSFGARFCNTYAGPDKHGVTIRLKKSDMLQILIQDDLTGLQIFNMMGQGHEVIF